MVRKSKTSNQDKEIAAKQKIANQELESKAAVGSAIINGAVIETFGKPMFPNLDIPNLNRELSKIIQEVQDGDMSEIEAMLISQAKALQAIFVRLSRQASEQGYFNHYDIFMKLALKAQSQSRSTIQALTELKNPRQVAFVRQANISHGHQQVNNQADVTTPSLTKENETHPNELLEVNHGSQGMDVGAEKSTVN